MDMEYYDKVNWTLVTNMCILISHFKIMNKKLAQYRPTLKLTDIIKIEFNVIKTKVYNKNKTYRWT